MVKIGITGVGGGVGQAVLRACRLSHLSLTTVVLDTNSLAPGLYWADQCEIAKPVASNAYIPFMVNWVERNGIELLIPGLDFELPILSHNRQAFEAVNCQIVVPNETCTKIACDKFKLKQFSEREGLSFVKTWLFTEALAQITNLNFPVIVKPRYGYASVGVQVITEAKLLELMDLDDNWIVQNYLQHVSENSLPHPMEKLRQTSENSIQFFIGGPGQLLGYFSSENNLKSGIPWEVFPTNATPAFLPAREIALKLSNIGYTGPLNIQGKITRSGPQFFEINARYTGLTGVRAAMNYREVDAAVHYYLEKDIGQAKSALNFHTDLIAVRYVEDQILPKRKHEHRSTSTRRSNFDSPHIFVTGANGYVGMEICRLLLASPNVASVTGLVSSIEKAVTLKSLDGKAVIGRLPLEDQWLKGIDVIVHAAALRDPNGDVGELMYSNVECTRLLALAATRMKVKKIIYLSSQSVYGTSRLIPWKESLEPKPKTAYAMSKWMGEQVLVQYLSDDLDFIPLRLAQIYGHAPGMRWEELPHKLAKMACEGKKLPLYDPEYVMDLLHVKDAAASVLQSLFVDKIRGIPINIGSGRNLTLAELARIIIQSAIKQKVGKPTIEWENKSNPHPRRYVMDIRCAQSIISWQPKVAIELALEELIRAANDMVKAPGTIH